jgi:RNA polymerase sigma factor for flagellar operon FliA
MALPEREKLVVTLHHYEELPMQQIAAILGVSPSTAYRLRRRALLRLKASLPWRAYPTRPPSSP